MTGRVQSRYPDQEHHKLRPYEMREKNTNPKHAKDSRPKTLSEPADTPADLIYLQLSKASYNAWIDVNIVASSKIGRLLRHFNVHIIQC